MTYYANTGMFENANKSSQHSFDSDDNSNNIAFKWIDMVSFHWILFATLGQACVVFGVISNILNIVCFVKQGFKDSVNVSLTGLAISDLACLLPLIWTNISYAPAFRDLDLSFEVIELHYITTGMTHVMFTRISSWVTAMITLERCMCVAMPLKVKEIATPKRAVIIITCIFVVLIAGSSPQYYYYRIGRKYVAERNKTLLGIIYSKKLRDFETISYPVNIVFVQVLAFLVIIISAIILVIELNVKAKWRKKSAASANTATLTSSNIKVANMVLMLSFLFIVSYLPVISNSIVINVVPGYNINGKFRHLFTVIGGIGFFFETVNASMNIFIYYHMSSKYRVVFQKSILQRK